MKSAQPMILLLDSVLNSQKEKKSIEASSILPLFADAVTFLGHTSYMTSLKRREFLKPDIAQAYQSVCSKSNPVTTCLFGDELPKHIKEIGEIYKIEPCLAQPSHPNVILTIRVTTVLQDIRKVVDAGLF